MSARLELSRSQILRFRRKAGSLDVRLPSGAKSLQRAAWAGLQDSVPRAALLSLHARVDGVKQSDWEHASLAQIWGPRFNVYVVAAKDLSIFTLGRLPCGTAQLQRATTTAEKLRAVLNGERRPFAHAGHAMGVHHNSLRYAAPTGTVLLRWDGARQPVIWCVDKPEIEAQHARLELARRYLHAFGPATHLAFARWAGIRPPEAKAAFDTLLPELIAVATPIGEAWILARDEPAFLARHDSDAPARLLPSGDAYYLLWGRDRELLVTDAKQRAALWTSRVWPGAVLVGGEIAGVWRRAASEISIETWRRLSKAEREAIEREAVSFPLPELNRSITVRWN